MGWLEEEVGKIQAGKLKLEQDLGVLYCARSDLMKKSGLESLEQAATEFIDKFDQLSGTQKRSFIERIIHKVVIKKDNKLELHVNWDPDGPGSGPKKARADRRVPLEESENSSDIKGVTRTTKSSIRKENGGRGLSRDRVFIIYISDL